MISPKSLLAGIAALIPATLACAATEAEKAQITAVFRDQMRDAVVACINGEIITLNDLRRETMRFIPELRRNAKSQSDYQRKIQELTQGTVQSLTDTLLLVSAFDDSGAVMDDNYIEQRINDIIEQDFDGDRSKYLQMLRQTGSNPLADKRRMRERIKAASWDDHIVQSAVNEISPAEVKAEYDARIEEFRSEASVEYAQIVMFAGASETDAQVKATAERIQKQLSANADDFEDTAKFYSRDDYRAGGGYVGWKPLADLSEQIVPELEKIKNGEVSSVIELDAPNGKIFVILKRIAYREAGITPLKDVRAQIENQLRSRKIQQRRAEKMAELRDEYHIRYY